MARKDGEGISGTPVGGTAQSVGGSSDSGSSAGSDAVSRANPTGERDAPDLSNRADPQAGVTRTPAEQKMADEAAAAEQRAAEQRAAAGAQGPGDRVAAKPARPLDEAPVKGGIYRRADGSLQNAHGHSVDESGKRLDKDEDEEG